MALTLDQPEIARAAWADRDIFFIIRVPAQLDRVFTREDDQPGRAAPAVAL